MTGFWTPIWTLIVRIFRLWWRALHDTAPKALQPYLHVFNPPIVLKTHDLIRGEIDAAILSKSIFVEIEPEQCLKYEFTLPECAGAELRRAVALEAERIFPLQYSRLISTHRILSVDKEKHTIKVEIIGARKRLIEEILDVSEKRALQLHSIGAAATASSGQIEFPIAALVRARRVSSAALMIAAIAAFLILVQVPTVYGGRMEAELDRLDVEILSARASTRKLASLQSEMQEKQNLTTAIATVKKRNRIIGLFERLSVASPDHVVLDTFRLNGERAHIAGTAQDPEEWAIELEAIPAFQEVVLLSVRGQQGEASQRFELRFQVQWDVLAGEVQ